MKFHLKPRRGSWRYSVTHDPTDDILPTSRWRSGQIIEDQTELVVPLDAERGRHSLEVELVGAGQGRVLLRTLRIEK